MSKLLKNFFLRECVRADVVADVKWYLLFLSSILLMAAAIHSLTLLQSGLLFAVLGLVLLAAAMIKNYWLNLVILAAWSALTIFDCVTRQNYFSGFVIAFNTFYLFQLIRFLFPIGAAGGTDDSKVAKQDSQKSESTPDTPKPSEPKKDGPFPWELQ